MENVSGTGDYRHGKRYFWPVSIEKVDEKRTLQLPLSLQENKLDGLIVIGEIDKAYIQKLKSSTEIPVVFLDFYDMDLAKNDAVVTDNFYGMYPDDRIFVPAGCGGNWPI